MSRAGALLNAPAPSCPRQDSNLRPFAPEANALSPELLGPGQLL